MLKINFKYDQKQPGGIPVDLVIEGNLAQNITEAAILCAQVANMAPEEIRPEILAGIFEAAIHILEEDTLTKSLRHRVDLSQISEFIKPEDREK